MKDSAQKIVVEQMKPRERQNWEKDVPQPKRGPFKERLLRRCIPPAAVLLCLGAVSLVHPGEEASPVSAGFEYDETLGRLQFVSRILPESAMVFLTDNDELPKSVLCPMGKNPDHPWNTDEPWLEYRGEGHVSSCMSGEVMTIVSNREDEYTVRLLHEDGYESVYSGLQTVSVEENNWIEAGTPLGTSKDFAAFELRRNGLSILPVFQHED